MRPENGSGNPEGEKGKKPRVSPERLLDVGPGFSQEVKKRIADMARTLEPYEDFASEFSHGPIGDKLALVEILDQQGILSPAFKQQFDAIARIVSGIPAALQEKFDRAPLASKRLLKGQLEAQVREHDRATNLIAGRLTADNRPLARNLYAEALRGSIVLSLERNIVQRGFSTVWREKKETSEDIHWIAFAIAAERAPLTERQKDPLDFSIDEKLRLLKEAQFQPSNQFAYQLPYKNEEKQLNIVMQVLETTNALTLVNFVIPFPGLNLNGSFSRATGELHVNNAMLLSLEEHFRIAGAQNAYKNLREIIINALFDAWEKGALTEEEYVTFDELPADNVVSIETVIKEDTIVDSTNSEESITEPETKPETEIAVSTAQTAAPVPERKKRYSTRRFTWRRVMAALKRCGVEIDMGHAHPKLRYDGKTAGYLNSHDRDTRHNRQVVQDTLATLQIPFETFLEKLR